MVVTALSSNHCGHAAILPSSVAPGKCCPSDLPDRRKLGRKLSESRDAQQGRAFWTPLTLASLVIDNPALAAKQRRYTTHSITTARRRQYCQPTKKTPLVFENIILTTLSGPRLIEYSTPTTFRDAVMPSSVTYILHQPTRHDRSAAGRWAGGTVFSTGGRRIASARIADEAALESILDVPTDVIIVCLLVDKMGAHCRKYVSCTRMSQP